MQHPHWFLSSFNRLVFRAAIGDHSQLFWEAADDPVAIITFLIKEVMCHPWPTLVAARTLKTNHDVYESRDGRAACFKCWHHVQAYNSNQYSQVIIESLIKIN